MRTETRAQRYQRKAPTARTMPVSVTTVNFMFDDNLAFIVRAAACFGASHVNVIGALPPRNVLKPLSGSTSEIVPIKQYSTVEQFLDMSRQANECLMAIELSHNAVPLEDFQFNFERPINLVVGHEESGVPGPIIHYADHTLLINMPGAGFCLNTSQAANIVLYEAAKQFFCY